MSDLLRNSGLNASQLDMLRTIRSSTGRLVSLIDDLLNVSRIDAGHVTFEATILDPVAVMRDTLRLVAPQALEKGLRLHLHVTPRTARAVLADRRRLGEITLNLLSNAVKFTRQGSVTLLLDVEDGGAQRGPVLRVEVEDTGIGIAPAAQERIFDTFTQADKTIANDFGGTGLGLAISRRLVRLQGGDIGVRSQPGRGSTFWFTLPSPLGATPALPIGDWHAVLQGLEPETGAAVGTLLAAEGLQVTELAAGTALPSPWPRNVVLIRSAASPPPGDPEEESSDMPLLLVETRKHAAELPGLPAPGLRGRAFATLAAGRLRVELPAAFRALTTARQPANDDDAPLIRRREKGRRILVVDDNQVNRMVISRILEAGGHHVTLASDGEEALDRLEDAAFDLVAMDLNMPVMDGIEATKLYRMASLDRPHLPIVALTADATAYARERALDAGMDACVTKPVDAVALLELVDSLVEGRPAVLPRVVAPSAPYAPPRATGVLNLRMLEDLLLLGGAEFVAEVIATFNADSARHLQALREDAARVDAQAFHDRLHALRSAASNVGASALADLCGSRQGVDADALRAEGPAMLEEVGAAVQAARAALLRWQAPPPVLVSRSG
jgi:two-component system sensor histidine kinase RpfC